MIRRDPRGAERMVARLSDLLRLTLENEATNEVPLKQELEFLEKYLEIEQTRFHDRLIIDLQIDARTLDAYVPNMILQPIVENAIRHGIAKRAGAGRIEIAAEGVNGSLCLRVRDDGRGLPENGETRTDNLGVGLANTRARLAQLYGARSRFELHNAVGGGLEVLMIIPFRNGDGMKNEENV
ncbi:MAG: histidine kinase [Pyrinomonadaceae bacterium]